MSTRMPRRASAAAVAVALAASLSVPIAAQANSSDDPSLPALTPEQSASQSDSQKLRFVPGPKVEPGKPSVKTSAPQALAAPAPITSYNVAAVGSTWAGIEWVPPTDGGSAITGYQFRLSSGGQVVEEATINEAISSVIIYGLDPDTAYSVEIAAINAEGPAPFSAPIPFTTTHNSIDRIFGQNRFETAVRVSEDTFPAGVQAAFVANGLNFPDALAAAAAGGTFGGPVLLTAPTSVTQGVKDELSLLQPEYVFVAGGTGSVSESVYNQVAAYGTVGADRVAGVDRFETAAYMSTLWESTDTVYLASGINYPDALSGAAAAGFNGNPVLLTGRDSLPAVTAAALSHHAPSRIVVLGGTGSVSTTVLNQAKAAAGTNPTVQRLAGADRYQTGVAISKATFPDTRIPVLYVASGAGFADALAGAAAAGYNGGPMLLTAQGSMSAAVLAEIDRLDPVRVVVLGGTASVSDAVIAQIDGVLG
ncbi:cell wall-binding repeat-containing protein [Microbacterium bovistercoris]|nr:cell wall-binding repeat-containing protein [Microbacterium bovistercoris]